jgi:outer membrane protein assembly factor BamB
MGPAARPNARGLWIAWILIAFGATAEGDGVELYRDAMNEPIELGFTPAPIAPPSATPGPPAPAAAGAAAPAGRWLNAAHNGRLSAPLPSGAWKVRWEVELGGAIALQHGAGRTVVQTPTGWSLLDAAGQRLGGGVLTTSDPLLDVELGVVLVEEADPGPLAAFGLDDGRQRWVTRLEHAGAHQRTTLARLPGGRLLVAGHAIPTGPHHQPDPSCGLAIKHLGDGKDIDGVTRFLKGTRREGVLNLKLGAVRAAVRGEEVVFAVAGGLFVADARLDVSAGRSGAFTPLHLSLSEDRIHLVVMDDSAVQGYWLLSASGDLLASLDWPFAEGAIAAPPLVGYDHTVYLVSDQEVRAVGADGKVAWTSDDLGGPLGGAAVSGDDRFLVAAGRDVSTFVVTQEGDAVRVARTPIATLEGHMLKTAPILTAEGHLLVGTKTHVVCLEPAS